MWSNLQETVDLVTFNKGICYQKLHFCTMFNETHIPHMITDISTEDDDWRTCQI